MKISRVNVTVIKVCSSVEFVDTYIQSDFPSVNNFKNNFTLTFVNNIEHVS